MAKTSISALQEFLQQVRESAPRYTEIPMPGESSNFIIRCECIGLSADGDAPNKKTAKHRAAGRMIKLVEKKYNFTILYTDSELPPPPSPAPGNATPIKTASGSPGFDINHVGKLNELCAQRRMHQPVYSDKCSTGPSHKPMFTVECRIGNLSVSQTAYTKKQAKQEAAGAMRELLKSKGIKSTEIESLDIAPGAEPVAVDDLVLEIDNLAVKVDPKVATATERAKTLYPILNKRVTRTVDTPANMLVSNYYKAFKAYFDPDVIERFHEYYKCLKITEHLPRAALTRSLQGICDILGVTWERYPMKTKQQDAYIVLYHIKSKPSFTEAGIGNSSEAADVDALHRLIGAIYILLV